MQVAVGRQQLRLHRQFGLHALARGQRDDDAQVARQLAGAALVPVVSTVIHLHLASCLRAVTSISMRMRGSARPALIIVAAGRTSPK